MKVISPTGWHPALSDPSGQRSSKPRLTGKTMVIDKGMGLSAYQDLLQLASAHIDMIKLGFGTSALYPQDILLQKIKLAKQHGMVIYPGGTFLEVAIEQGMVEDYFETVCKLGFTGVEVSDGTITFSRSRRDELITQAKQNGFRVFTEYGKKYWGSQIEMEELKETVFYDLHFGAEFVTIEGRESGAGVGIYDENGSCRDDALQSIMQIIETPQKLLWEAPKKAQQVHLLKLLGSDINLGNIAPDEVLSLESLRRGLRSDTFVNHSEPLEQV